MSCEGKFATSWLAGIQQKVASIPHPIEADSLSKNIRVYSHSIKRIMWSCFKDVLCTQVNGILFVSLLYL